MDVKYLGPLDWKCVANFNSFLRDTNQDYNFFFMQRNCSYACVLSVSSLPAFAMSVYGSML